MIVVRMVFQAKFGKAGEVVAAFKRGQAIIQEIVGGQARARFLTDLSGPFDTVVQEVEVESLAEWERTRMKLFTDPRFREMQASGPSLLDLVEGGRTEYYTVEP